MRKKVQIFLKIVEKFCFRKNGHQSATFQDFELLFIANILILTVLSDFTIKILGYRRSIVVTSKKIKILRILMGTEGVPPQKFDIPFLPKIEYPC